MPSLPSPQPLPQAVQALDPGAMSDPPASDFESGALARAVLDMFAAALCVVKSDRSIQAVNRAAREMFARHAGLEACGGRLCCTDPRAMRRLEQALHRVCDQHAAQDAFLVGTRVDTRLQVRVSRLPDRDARPGAGSGLAVVAAAALRDGYRDEAVTGVLFDLTLAERRLLGALAAGGSLSEHAQADNVAISTVRSHLRSIFRKTGASSQAQLVAIGRVLPTTVPVRNPPPGGPPGIALVGARTRRRPEDARRQPPA